jgi:chemotaxis protein CheX
MNAQHIHPFIRSLAKTFQTMLQCRVSLGKLWPQAERAPLHEVTAVLGLTGKAAGTVVVSFSKPLALRAAAAMLLSEATEIDADVVDAVGELANMIAGGAKAELPQWEMSLSTPSVVVGSPYTIRFPSNVEPVCMTLDTDWGPMALEVGLAIPGAVTQAMGAAGSVAS